MKVLKFSDYEEDFNSLVNLYYSFLSSNNMQTKNMKNLNANMAFLKLVNKMEKESYGNGGGGLEQLQNYQKLLKEYLAVHIIKYKLINSMEKFDLIEKENSYEIEYNLNIYKLFCILEDDKNEVSVKSLGNITNLVIGDLTNISSFDNFMAQLDFKIDIGEKNKISFEIFLPYVTILINFLCFAQTFTQIFDVLDIENKGKVLTAELVVCMNKISRNLDFVNKDNSMSFKLLKSMSEQIDTNQVYIKKTDFFTILLKLVK